jgi:RNA polymerase sigma factor (TIGR02999 family)
MPMSEVTRVLEAIGRGEPQRACELLPLVYEELRKLAKARLAREPAGQTLQATALVHEAYIRLVGDESSRSWESRGHFFAAAAEAMRRILIEAARRKRASKRGGGRARREFDLARLVAPEMPGDLLALDDSLGRLEAIAPKQAALVKLRYFAGLTIPQAAEALGIAPRTADAYWSYARAWLLADLQDPPE